MGYKFIPNPDGELRIFEPPKPGMVYTMGIDGATGLSNDFSGIQIVTNSIPFTQVARYRSKSAVHAVAEYANHLGRWYNEALNVCEINYPGNSIQDSLLSYWKYPRNYQPETHLKEDVDISHSYGFRTTEQTKWLLIQQTLLMMESREVKVNDLVTLAEINNFVFQAAKRQAAAAPGFNDDLVMSWMLALHGAKLYPIIAPKAVKIEQKTKDPDAIRDWRAFRQKLYGKNKQGVLL